ncbi:MAG TPA: bifunctional phosphopantothenoylcysteine decarboxylase/phosphopantothenate--cysteine ligase CoaBC [Thermodesulfobacteriota bacterium]|nr:bifunctional phosphopantothenoylcysteine decarboxylase/phosphopantothenate--cysteine ligase CoaBC [Thermodesulfobacteriota bacterium]
MLTGKNIIVGISGGIAAYKVPELVRKLRKAAAEVQVVMTKNAQEFITPLTFQTVSNNPVITEMFAPVMTSEVAHVSLADKADLVVVAPATANIIAKFALGLADDFLSTTVLATKAPVLLAPAMNVNMYTNPATQGNLEILKKRGFYCVGPGKGELACGWEGEGRMSEVEEIFQSIKTILRPKDLKGKKFLVTAGPTQEPLDPIRFITNRSSGKMGYALAEAAQIRGAEVTLITGPTQLPLPCGVKVISVETAGQMYEATIKHYLFMDTVIMAAAVADYRPAEFSPQKIKKEKNNLPIALVKNPDILAEMGQKKGSAFLVGFAAETEDLLANAQQKLQAKNVDLIIANDVTQPGAGFETDTNIVTLLCRNGKPEKLSQMSKEFLAHKILDKILEIKSKGKT